MQTRAIAVTAMRTCAMALPVAALPVAALLLGASLRAASGVSLTDVTAAAGVGVMHANGAAGKKYLPETMGSGAAFVDVDGDGDQDLIVVSGVWSGGSAYARLFKNDGRGRFAEATAGSGLEGPPSRPAGASARRTGDGSATAGPDYGMGIAAGDFDNDGAPDLLLTAAGSSRLFRNLGGGRFADVSVKAGFGTRRAFSTSAMWFDYDKDGRLDLLICNYVQWTPAGDVFCSADGKTKSYCTPEAYRGSTSWLYRNRGDGTFEDVTAKAGFFDATSKSLGVTLLDYDQDGWPDVFVANDTQPNKLYRNNRNGTFTELGLKAGVAFSEEGRARAGMGVDAVDLDGSGRPTVAVTNFSGEMLGLFRADADGQYVDRAPGSDIGRATRQTLGWGCFFFDVNLDGQQDLLVVNGRLDTSRVANGAPAGVSADTPHLFLNASGRFTDVARDAGAAFATPKMGRGAAFADIDGDGDLDAVITTNGGPLHLYRTDAPAGNRSLRLRLVGNPQAGQGGSNRDGIGARASIRVGTASASRIVRTGSSYLSQSELPLTFGLGAASRADEVTIVWPSGRRETLGALDGGHEYTVTEGTGVTAKRATRR
jgi:enediyne biosynthesis protein E4